MQKQQRKPPACQTTRRKPPPVLWHGNVAFHAGLLKTRNINALSNSPVCSVSVAKTARSTEHFMLSSSRNNLTVLEDLIALITLLLFVEYQ